MLDRPPRNHRQPCRTKQRQTNVAKASSNEIGRLHLSSLVSGPGRRNESPLLPYFLRCLTWRNTMSPTLKTEPPAAENKYIYQKKKKLSSHDQTAVVHFPLREKGERSLKAPLIAAAPPSARRVYQPLSSSESCRSIKQLAPGVSPDSQWGRFIGGDSRLVGRLLGGRLHHRLHRPQCAPAGHPVVLQLVG